MSEVYKSPPTIFEDVPAPVPTSEQLMAHPDAPKRTNFDEVDGAPPNSMTFRPRTLGTRVFGLLALGLAVAATAMTVAAFKDPNVQTVGIGATLWALAGIIWAVRSGNSTARLSLNGPLLLVEYQGRREVFDLSSKWTPVEVSGSPKSMSWKVTFHRAEIGPYVIDATMVDPEEFMKVLDFFQTRMKPE